MLHVKYILRKKKLCMGDWNSIIKNCFSPSLILFSTILEMFIIFVGSHKPVTMYQQSALFSWPSLGHTSTSASRNDPTQAKWSKSMRYGNCQAEVHCTLRILLAAGIWEAVTESWIKESLWKHRFWKLYRLKKYLSLAHACWYSTALNNILELDRCWWEKLEKKRVQGICTS